MRLQECRYLDNCDEKEPGANQAEPDVCVKGGCDNVSDRVSGGLHEKAGNAKEFIIN